MIAILFIFVTLTPFKKDLLYYVILSHINSIYLDILIKSKIIYNGTSQRKVW